MSHLSWHVGIVEGGVEEEGGGQDQQHSQQGQQQVVDQPPSLAGCLRGQVWYASPSQYFQNHVGQGREEHLVSQENYRIYSLKWSSTALH
jgi:hypothetical protein